MRVRRAVATLNADTNDTTTPGHGGSAQVPVAVTGRSPDERMGRTRYFLLAPLLAAASAGQAIAREDADAAVTLCPGYTLAAPVDPPLSEEEIRMICGFPEAGGTGDEVWTEIPRNQALAALRAALQARAHHQPEIRAPSEGAVLVHPGPRTYIGSVSADGAPEGFDITRRRNIVGTPLVPEALDTLEAWTTESLQRLGYACPRVSSAAGVSERHVLVDIAPGERRPFGAVTHLGIEGALEEQLDRFHAFSGDWTFDRTALEATAARLIGGGVVEAAELAPACAADDHRIMARIVPGEPRLVSLRLAASTEEWLRVDARFQHRAFGDGYLLLSEAAARVSRRLQELSLSTAWYPAPSRLWLEPLLVARRMDERPFEITTAQFGVSLAQGGDRPGMGWEVRAGPNLARWWVHEGPGEDATALSVRIAARAWSHDHEVWRTEPQSGWAVDVQAELADRDAGSDFDARRIEFGGETRINVRGDFPPSLIIALRGRAGTTFTDEGAIDRLPPVFLHYLGGIADLRGFRRMDLPRDRVALTRAFAGIEARPGLLATPLEPLVFLDAGMLGEREARLDGSVYWSLGVGLRWNSPVGPVRATLGNGWESDDSEGLRIFLSWGETF